MDLPFFKPKVIRVSGGFRFEWNMGFETEGFMVEFTRLRERGSNELTAEVMIGFAHHEYPIISHTRFNLTSSNARAELAKKLNKLYPAIEYWDELLNFCCAETVLQHRQSDPLEELWVTEDTKAPVYLLEPILFERLPTTIFGEKGSAKSLITFTFYVCLTLPWHDNPLGLTAPSQTVKTAILDWETDKSIILYQAKRLGEGMGFGGVPIFYKRCVRPLVDEYEQVEEYLNKYKIQAVIIDSLGAAAGGDDLAKPGPALEFFEALRQLKVGAIIVGQTSKGEDKRKTIFGSTYFTYYSRSIWEITKAQEEGEDDIDVALFHRWSNISKIHRPMSFHIHFNDQAITIESQPVNVGQFIEKVSTQAKIYETLKGGSMSTQEIVELLGLSVNTAKVTLHRMKAKNKVVKLGDNKWGLCSSF